jgi:hypothetical protein
MNANELATYLENMKIGFTSGNVCLQAATMLRQQQSEIEALKGGFFDWSGFKELTNEEISDIRDEFFAPNGCNIYTFSKAILRKAKEK